MTTSSFSASSERSSTDPKYWLVPHCFCLEGEHILNFLNTTMCRRRDDRNFDWWCRGQCWCLCLRSFCVTLQSLHSWCWGFMICSQLQLTKSNICWEPVGWNADPGFRLDKAVVWEKLHAHSDPQSCWSVQPSAQIWQQSIKTYLWCLQVTAHTHITLEIIMLIDVNFGLLRSLLTVLSLVTMKTHRILVKCYHLVATIQKYMTYSYDSDICGIWFMLTLSVNGVYLPGLCMHFLSKYPHTVKRMERCKALTSSATSSDCNKRINSLNQRDLW